MGRYGNRQFFGRLETTPPLHCDDCRTQKQFCCHQTRFLGSKYHTHTFLNSAGGVYSVSPDSWLGERMGRDGREKGKGREREAEGGRR